MASVLNLCHRFVGLRFSAQCDPLEFIQRALVPLFRACGRNPLQLTLRNTYTCSTCNTPVGTSDCQTGINLHMDITDGHIHSVSTRLKTYLEDERIDEMACHSEMCNGSQRCFDNHKDILTAPDLFMIILARYDQYGQHLKNNHTVPIDMEVTLPTSRRRAVNKYTLQSLIQHRGNTTVGGHFTAVCRRADDSFFVIDDARSYAWNRKVTEQNAYILFYTKQTSAYSSRFQRQ